MKINLLVILPCFIALGFFGSCDDIIVPDISEDNLVLIAPADSMVTTVKDQTFWWKENSSAESYQLVIVSPTIANPVRLELDTTITKQQFDVTLAAGTYEWCVRGKNSAYETEYTCRVLIVE
jgi:hypothetical protein